MVEMGWNSSNNPTTAPSQTSATQQVQSPIIPTSGATGRPSEEVLKEWQTVILPMLQQHPNVPVSPEHVPLSTSHQMLFLDAGPYNNLGRSSNYGPPVAVAPPAPRFYHGHHRSWSPSRFTEEAEIHLPRRPAPTREPLQPTSSQQSQQPVAPVKPHIPRLPEPEKDF